MILGSHQGFVSFGVLAVLGEITCLLAAVLSLPAFLKLTQKSKDLKKENPIKDAA
jgi:predicted RND superfamily exporter protein